ncbi:heme-degrading domain-containing protein [Aminobacter sp. LjRoot7]|uniref:heme-degrading domain-containing protein n=1 Tax=Aminobacter sp. LjRoot7 TaxID=3342335 RepID=UPI003ED00C20
MAAAEDLEKIAEQEDRLVFDRFDEAVAFDIGSAIRARGLAENFPIIVDIRLWDRALFYSALPGSTVNNTDWARRKINVVRTFHRSSYRMVLQKARSDRTFPVGDALPIDDYVLAGGGFPIKVKGVGVIGAIAVSGLPERQDHEVVVTAIADHLGIPSRELALPPVANS